MKKKPTLYCVIISVWLVCVALLGFSLYKIISELNGYSAVRFGFIVALLALNTVVLAVLWFVSLKDFVFSVAYALLHKRLDKRYEEIEQICVPADANPRILLLYCTCNDFNAKALTACRKQTYRNCKTVILDDSDDPHFRRQIDEYQLRYGNVEVVRRTERTGYKAGNLNNYLKGRTDYDYFVVLDSDEIIPPDFIEKTLKDF